jgi:hypothetical protein
MRGTLLGFAALMLAAASSVAAQVTVKPDSAAAVTAAMMDQMGPIYQLMMQGMVDGWYARDSPGMRRYVSWPRWESPRR